MLELKLRKRKRVGKHYFPQRIENTNTEEGIEVNLLRKECTH